MAQHRLLEEVIRTLEHVREHYRSMTLGQVREILEECSEELRNIAIDLIV